MWDVAVAVDHLLGPGRWRGSQGIGHDASVLHWGEPLKGGSVKWSGLDLYRGGEARCPGREDPAGRRAGVSLGVDFRGVRCDALSPLVPAALTKRIKPAPVGQIGGRRPPPCMP
jgi:hypothetical protein